MFIYGVNRMSIGENEEKTERQIDPMAKFLFGGRRFQEVNQEVNREENQEENFESNHSERKNFRWQQRPFSRQRNPGNDWLLGGRNQRSQPRNEIEKVLNQVDYELLMETIDSCYNSYEQIKPLVFPYLQKFIGKFKQK